MTSRNKGKQISEMLMNMKASCPRCGTNITFEEGVRLAQKRGIKGLVVMCTRCQSVYTIELSPHGISFIADVTDKYLPKVDPQSKVELPAKENLVAPSQEQPFTHDGKENQAALSQEQPFPLNPKALECKKCGHLFDGGEFSCSNCGTIRWNFINSWFGGAILGLAILILGSYYAFNSHSVFWIVIAVICDLLIGSIMLFNIRSGFIRLTTALRLNRIRKIEQVSVKAEIICPACGHKFEEARAVVTTRAMVEQYGPNPVKCPNCNHIWGLNANVVNTFKV